MRTRWMLPAMAGLMISGVGAAAAQMSPADEKDQPMPPAAPDQIGPYDPAPFEPPPADRTQSSPMTEDKTVPRSDTNPINNPPLLNPPVPYPPVPEAAQPPPESQVLVPPAPLPPDPPPQPAPPAPPAPRPMWGNAVELGGGFTSFTNGSASGRTQPGGYWDLRAVTGTRRVLAFEAAYVGSLQAISALGLDQGARIMKNGVEGALRLNAPITTSYRARNMIEPYAFGGLGYSRYNLTNTTSNATSDMNDVDDIMALPVGAGLAAAANGFVFDARFTYRMTYYNDLFVGSRSNGTAGDLNNWSLGANVGAEF